MKRVLFFANTDWYLYNFRLPLARAIKSLGIDVVLVSPSGPYVRRLEAAGFRCIQVDMMRRSLNPFRELRLVNELHRVYKAESPDLVHHFTIKCVVYGSLVAGLLGIRRRINAVAGTGFVFSSSSLIARALRPLVALLMRVTLRGRSARLIVQNEEDLKAFVSNGLVSPERARLIRGSGVDTSRFVPTHFSTDAGFNVLMASRLIREKGVALYVAAAARIRARRPGIRFLLAGSPDPGNPSSITSSELELWGKSGNVELLGHVEDMAKLLATVNLVVLPTNYGEGVPRSLIEAASCEIPIVASNIAGCREVVDNGVNGLLVPPDDSRALEEAILSLAESREACLRMGRAGRQKVLQEFDQQAVIRKTLSVYGEVWDGHVSGEQFG